MDKVRCPKCNTIQNVYSKKDKLDMKCKKKLCGTTFSAERIGDKYERPKRKRKLK